MRTFGLSEAGRQAILPCFLVSLWLSIALGPFQIAALPSSSLYFDRDEHNSIHARGSDNSNNHPHPKPPSKGSAIVQTRTQGSFKGNQLGSVQEFLNIPYAQPPVGPLRFAKTASLSPYKGDGNTPRDATKPGPICYQPKSTDSDPSQTQSEDCLQLNLYRPAKLSPHAQVPVLFWIYGGSWQEGSANEPRINATDFVKRSIALGEPVIHVVANYRAGAFGYLAGQAIIDAQKSGQAVLNPGLYDHVEALNWIQNNIAAFGGDPKKVTIYGQSAGAADVAILLLANKGKAIQKLARGAIMQSGSAGTYYRTPASHPYPTTTYQNVLQGAGCPNNTDSATQISCLKALSPDKLLNASENAISNGYIPFTPVQDSYFITDVASSLYAAQRFARIPFIAGNVLDEGTEFPYPDTVSNDDQFKQATVLALGSDITPVLDGILATWSKDPTKGEPYRPEYFGVSPSDTFYPPNGTNQYKRQAASFQDIYFETPRRDQLKAARKAHVPAWSYRFAQASPVGVSFSDPPVAQAALGVQHESDIPYVYAHPFVQGAQESRIPTPLRYYASDANITQVSNVMSAAWIHFANYLNPNGRDVPRWDPYASGSPDKYGNGRMLYVQANNYSMVDDNLGADQSAWVARNRKYFWI